MIRTFKQFTIAAGGTPQPLVGTTTSAALPPQPASGNTFTLGVVDGSIFRQGDWAVIGKPSTGQERIFVQGVSGNTLTLLAQQGTTGNYASGVYIRPSFAINSTYVQTKVANTGAIYIGTADNMVKATQVFCVALLQQVASGQPTEFRDGRSGLANADNSSQLWVDGTTNDGYLPSFGVL